MIKIKPGVKLNDLSPQIALAVGVVAGVYDKYSFDMTITSLNDSHHSMNSLHNIGHAADIRTKNLSLTDEEKADLVLEILEALGGVSGPYDVILEYLGRDQEHLHIEYQPHWAA